MISIPGQQDTHARTPGAQKNGMETYQCTEQSRLSTWSEQDSGHSLLVPRPA